jgi:hypothetical protein
VEHLVPNDVFLLWMKRSHFVISLIPVSDHPCPASAGLPFLAAEPTTAIRIALARKEGMSFRKSIADRVP